MEVTEEEEDLARVQRSLEFTLGLKAIEAEQSKIKENKILQIEQNKVKIPNWQEADQLAVYKRG